jgi:predicted DNA-binding transcriptional regulator AlpA
MPTTKPSRHHVDRYATDLAEVVEDGSPDDLLETGDAAKLLGVSRSFLEIGRCRGYGPRFIKLSTRCVRYRRSDILKWLASRTYGATHEYQHGGRS